MSIWTLDIYTNSESYNTRIKVIGVLVVSIQIVIEVVSYSL